MGSASGGMRIGKFRVTRFGFQLVISARLNVIRDLLVIAAFVGAVLTYLDIIPASPAIIPDVNRLGISVVIGLAVSPASGEGVRHCAIAIPLPDLVRGWITNPAAIRPAVSSRV